MTPTLKYLQGYDPATVARVAQLLQEQRLGQWLQDKYAQGHGLRTDKALYDYVQLLRQAHLRGAEPVTKVMFDSKLQVVAHALGTHTTVARVQGSRLKAKREIRIAALFKDVPAEFLKMIAVHELAQIEERRVGKECSEPCRSRWSPYH